MVVFDMEQGTCELYEIKHSAQIAPEQYRHLIDERRCKETAFRYGNIIRRCVIYRGETTEVDGVTYWNVEEYLKTLS